MKKILIIEDDKDISGMYRQKLEMAGFEVAQEYDGKKAQMLVKNTLPDLVLLDIILGGKVNGFDILEDIRRDPRTKNILVLVLTNLETEEKVAKEIGANEYVIKANTTPGDLVQKIKSMVGL
ncbi:hypothetical protein A3D84_03930 [Candidatus Woesebacteria bacterium RIFCSPHIGHO2_02_FULL_42_20]|uniref:Response regulatory domain-containing protein n=1 Tax=Candidatus Woesebacteria bacterium RIFCSPHIGHO2_12_FULL_41_24 TaxID=1802510 RepID=A0A1F8AU70_9BACT|nr:MAG: hypothetical protein A2W15_04085 [Candidatus Woesebacteria bacterium RBG_16_41_13]OGM29116.1 MAG: hypothetical protein A2873_00080 [Candidatus Woesebacteria bacterium RIFCSPHIGHO2_01_FULL_42_80]OGM35681.1 MAG: hypothetical protein A3D84_03930 [Candidatus Woesebacteria bacterium RIFCSPHIGHO2_02_FULL_42_20]OGM55292.1 MAG: hypothetical protein A3E44_03340 [Candidatus Woesebacteria bacterium RIFCSPHIGHO2_12_FULL_41_24]OGM66794.1 MAG: hypothetical protein A2969_00080 [Candidatus Woesebacteri